VKIAVSLCCLLLLICGFAVAHQQQSESGSGGFSVQGEPTQPNVAGPDDIVPLVHVVEQPDSPLEIASVNLQETSRSSSEGQYTEQYTVQPCVTYKVHNRADRVVQSFDLELLVSPGEGGSTDRVHSSAPLAPGQTVEIKSSCSSIHNGSAARNQVNLKLLVSVLSVDFGDCLYRPSLRMPRSLGVIPRW
jgi:hypothetical protein